MWKPIRVDKKEEIRITEQGGERLDCLDTIPKKSVAEQVRLYIEMGERLELSRIEMLNKMEVGDDEDIEEADTGLDDYSDLEDLQRAVARLADKERMIREQQTRRTPLTASPPPSTTASEGDAPKQE